jgi:hypothetical protein
MLPNPKRVNHAGTWTADDSYLDHTGRLLAPADRDVQRDDGAFAQRRILEVKARFNAVAFDIKCDSVLRFRAE